MMRVAVLGSLCVVLSQVASGQFPTTYCTAGISSNFCVPQISAELQPNTENSGRCVVSVRDVPGDRLGVVFYGVDNSGFQPSLWGGPTGTSYLCVRPPTARLGAPLNSGGIAGACNGSFSLDWDAYQSVNPASLGNPWIAGDLVFAQAWYRDPLALKSSNLSDAVQLTVRTAPAPCSVDIPGMVVIPWGTFQMGSAAPSGPPYYNLSFHQTMPVHQVTISYCFWMGATEVTQAQYAALMGVNPSNFPQPDKPVEQVSWFDALAYCAALTAQQSSLGNVPPGYQYRLPTEAEWEYACRAGSTTEFNVGAALLCNQAKIGSSDHANGGCTSSGTAPVGSYAPNAWGLFDMHGNVAEWCLDSQASYSSGHFMDPFVTGGPERIQRGGGWDVPSRVCRSASRSWFSPVFPSWRLGLRVVLAPILVP